MEEDNNTTSPMSLEEFRLMTIENLRVFLALRKKSTDGDYDTLVARAFTCAEENVQIDSNAEIEHLSTQEEYKKKLVVNDTVLPDPESLKQWQGESEGLTNWPPIYYHDIARYLNGINTPGEFLHRLDCHYKEGKGYRYFECEFVKDVFWHGISKNSKICFLKSKVTPSQRTSSAPYKVWAAIEKSNPGGAILSAYCTCTAGLLGSCNHVIAMLFRVEAAVSSGVTKPTCTSRLSIWNQPAKTKTLLTMEPIKNLPFCTSTYRKRKNKSDKIANIEALNNFNPCYDDLDSNEKMRDKLYGAFKTSNTNSRFVEIMEYTKKHRGKEKTNISESDTLPNSILQSAQIYNYDHDKTITENVQLFTETLALSQQNVLNIYNATTKQSESEFWMEQRKGRITASKFYDVFTRMNTVKKNPNENPSKLIEQLICRKSFFSLATKHGIAMEVHAKEAIKKILQRNHQRIVFVENPGMTVDRTYPFLSVSPDLEGSCLCCGKFVVEIKCPYSICETIPTVENQIYLYEVETENELTVKLKSNHKYYAQIQGQLAVTHTEKAWFFIYTHHGYHLEEIEFDGEYWQNLKHNLVYCWFNYLAPTILKQFHLDAPDTPILEPINQPNISATVSTEKVNITNKKIANPKVQKPKTKKQRKRKIPSPQIYLCGICGKDCVENFENFKAGSIRCTTCKLWFHFGCVNFTGESDIPKQNKRWDCEKCSSITTS